MSFADLSHLRAVVTGSSTGIGRAIALQLASAGADVIVHAYRSRTAAEEVVTEIRSMGQRSELLLADLGEESERSYFFHAARDRWDGIDIWINNAGVDLLTGSGLKLSYSEKLQKLWKIDVEGTVALSRMAGEHMKQDSNLKSDQGVILNIGWDQAERGMGGESGELFSTAKNAIMGFTRSLSVSLAPEVRVNCIAPGWVKTAWGEQASTYWQERVLAETPLKRWGNPDDIARLARFLVSSEASFITGQVMNVNGGAIR